MLGFPSRKAPATCGAVLPPPATFHFGSRLRLRGGLSANPQSQGVIGVCNDSRGE